MTTIYITKYALTRGILVKPAKISSDRLGVDRLCVVNHYDYFWLGRDAFLTLEEAQAKAEFIRQRRIRSLEKQIEVLKKKTVKVVEQ